MDKSKIHKLAITSALSYKELIKSGKNISQSKFIKIKLQELGIASSRMLMDATGIERGNITRELHNFESQVLVEVTLKRCKQTEKLVKHYQLV